MSGGVPAGERHDLTYREQMLDAQAQCLPCKLCGGKAVISDAGIGAGYYIACENSTSFRSSSGCLIDQRRLGGVAYNVMEWWNRLMATPTPPIEGRDADVERECQAVWRCAIGDAVGALDVLRTQWEKSRRKHEREAGAKLAIVLDLVWAARDPAAVNYKEAHANGNGLIARARAALQALGKR